MEHLLPDMPDLSDDEKEKDNKKEGGKEVENVEDEVKTKSSPTNKYVVQMVNEVLENSSPDGKKTWEKVWKYILLSLVILPIYYIIEC